MIEKIRTLSTGESIFIYDNVFTPYESAYIKHTTEKSYYRLGTITEPSVNLDDQESFFQSMYSQEDVDNLRMFNSENFRRIFEKHIKIQSATRSWVNVTTHLTDYRYHVDSLVPGRKSLLYYINAKWHEDWGGETIFKNSNGEPEIAVEFKPNRVVIFNSDLSHKPTSLSLKSHAYRFIFVQQFEQEKSNT